MDAAVDHQIGPVDEGGVVGDQEQTQRSHVGRFPVPAERNAGFLVRSGNSPSGFNAAGEDVVDPDARGARFNRQLAVIEWMAPLLAA